MQMDYKGYIAVIVIRLRSHVTQRAGRSKRLPLAQTVVVERRSIKCGRDWKARYIFGGQLIDGRARALVTRLGTLPAGAYLHNNVSLKCQSARCLPSDRRKNHAPTLLFAEFRSQGRVENQRHV